jgi:hypothetical protein
MTRSLYAENVVVDMRRTALASVRTTCASATVFSLQIPTHRPSSPVGQHDC